MSAVRLTRAAGYGRAAPPVRLVHLGLGNFFRAHQCWYTQHAPDAPEWGIAAFTGRGSGPIVDDLTGQDGLYTLVTRAADTDRALRAGLSGGFPADRPRWQDAGATFTDDVTPFEHRKLWLLNGAHSLLAYAGSIRGHATVAEAVDDPTCHDWLQQWWSVASPLLHQPAADLAAYQDALVERFANARMQVTDARADEVVPLAQGPLREGVPRVLDRLDPAFGEDAELVATVVQQAGELADPD